MGRPTTLGRTTTPMNRLAPCAQNTSDGPRSPSPRLPISPSRPVRGGHATGLLRRKPEWPSPPFAVCRDRSPESRSNQTRASTRNCRSSSCTSRTEQTSPRKAGRSIPRGRTNGFLYQRRWQSKTDSVDAALIVRFGRREVTVSRALPSEAVLECRKSETGDCVERYMSQR